MPRPWWVAAATVALTSSYGAAASAEPTAIGGWFGPRVFSASSRLGYIDDAPAHPELQNGIALGARVARPFLPWLVPEVELALSPTSTNAVGGAKAASVLWLEPRLHLRFELQPQRWLQPFVVVGGGAPVSLSGASKTYATSILADGYVGGGLRLRTGKGFDLRADVRIAAVPSRPGSGFIVTPELDVGFGLEFKVGGDQRMTPEEIRLTQGPPPPDRDHDGVPDEQDACPDRPEDIDGFDDSDGCPDIDNDLDRVLDIADKCPNVPETYNGYEDDDGCPDTVPADVDALRGTIEGLIYGEGETFVRDSALPSLRKMAKTMLAHPSIRLVLIGHTDDREARQLAPGGAGEPEIDALAIDLSKARAESVKNALIAAGVPRQRVAIDGKGGAEPVADNGRPRGRLANRRVEVRLYVPPR